MSQKTLNSYFAVRKRPANQEKLEQGAWEWISVQGSTFGQHWTGRYRGETRGMDGRDLGATAEDTGSCRDGHGG